MKDTLVGVVVIGRNEGDRLLRCLASLGDLVKSTVYVDSGSTDGSVTNASSLGAQVVVLDRATPFTAARARNAGLAAALAATPGLEFVQFVDGDCEVEPQWLDVAVAALRADASLAVVFGRRRERHREASIYNTLCDLEWDVPIGLAESCGGDAMMRVRDLAAVGGYDALLIAGEEPDLCRRLLQRGGRVRRIDAPMTVHDAAMHRFSQWWRRTQRSGYVEAEGMARFGFGYTRWRGVVGSLGFAVALPLLAIGMVVFGLLVASWPWIAAGMLGPPVLYLVQFLRIRRRAARQWSSRDAAAYAWACIVGKWPAAHGMAIYWWRRLTGRAPRLIEYKG